MDNFYFLFSFIIIISTQLSCEIQPNVNENRKNHEHLEIPYHRLSIITKLTDKDHFKRVLNEILIPRVVGTPGHDKVRDFIIKSMKDLNWEVEIDAFEDRCPNDTTFKFENIIATLNPDADRFLVLACHYDSKYFKDEEFLGATDSAVPCAMLINLAYVLKEHLSQKLGKNYISLKFIFFDGEEAFNDWGPKDSLYGARHLAKKWEKERFLTQIDLLILLDLLGTPDPKFYSFFKNTEKWYAHLFYIEERLARNNYLESYTRSSAVSMLPGRYFQAESSNLFIEDDHIPFLKRDVPILHLIPLPFPDVWHKMTDNASVIDYNTVENLNKILRIFVIEYLNIEV